MEYPEGIKRSADISDCGRYRYCLGRSWDTRIPSCVFVGLNPSTADAEKDDATIRRCISFTQRFGFGGFTMLNLYAFRATDPRELLTVANPIGPGNNKTFLSVSSAVNVFICAWGPPKSHYERKLHFSRRVREVLELIAQSKVYCLGLSKEGYPRHPLRIPTKKDLEEYEWKTEKEKEA